MRLCTVGMLFALLLGVTASAQQSTPPSGSAAPTAVSREQAEADFKEATETILCDCGCHPQSVAACTCGRATEMKGEIAQRIESGMNAEEVIQSYVDESGEQIRIAPVATGVNLIAWLGPLVGLVLATLLILLMLRRWTKRAAANPSVSVAGAGARPLDATAEGAPALGDDEAQAQYRKRLQADLEDFE